jgi:hypothetical protein
MSIKTKPMEDAESPTRSENVLVENAVTKA